MFFTTFTQLLQTFEYRHASPDLCSRAADVLHVLDAVDAAVWDFNARHTYIIPETARAFVAKPADLTYTEKTHTIQAVKKQFHYTRTIMH